MAGHLQTTLLCLAAILTAFNACKTNDSPRCVGGAEFQGELAPAVSAELAAASRSTGVLREFDPQQEAQLDNAMAELRTGAMVEVSAAVIAADGRLWSIADERRMWWGSVGKAFTSMALLDLDARGELDLSEPVSRFVSFIPNGDVMTVRHLLSHTSGIPNFTVVEGYEHEAIYRAPESLLALAIVRGSDGCPGAQLGSSNSGYLVVGRVVEQVTGKPYHEVINRMLSTWRGPGTLEVLGPGVPPEDIVLPVRGDSPPPSIITPSPQA